MPILKKFFLKNKYRNTGMFISAVVILQFAYVNFIDQKEPISTGGSTKILDSHQIQQLLLQKPEIKSPSVSPLSIHNNERCQIISQEIICRDTHSDSEKILRPPKIPVSISTSENLNCLIDNETNVFCWQTTNSKKTEFQPIPLHSSAIQISLNNKEACALLKTGEIYCWQNHNNSLTQASRVNLDESITSISSFGEHHCATNKRGNIICWGESYTSEDSEFTRIQIHEKAARVISGPTQDCMITWRKRELICWTPDFAQISKAPQIEKIHEVGLSENMSCGLTIDGKVYCWQKTNLSEIKLQKNTSSDFSPLISISSGPSEVCGLNDNQKIFCWN